MEVSYSEGLASHTGPESCVGARKGAGFFFFFLALTGTYRQGMSRECMPRHEAG